MAEMKKFKIVVVGGSGVGKTRSVEWMRNETLEERKHIPTLGVNVVPISHNNCVVNVWDCAGDPRFKGLGSGYWLGAHLALVMYDSEESKQDTTSIVQELEAMAIPKLYVQVCKGEYQDESADARLHTLEDVLKLKDLILDRANRA